MTRKNAPRGRVNKNAYKVGKLSKNTRFSRKKKLNPVPFIILAAILLSFIFAVVLGNHLSKKAEDSQNAAKNNSSSSIVLPSVDKVSPKLKLHAYLADLHGATPDESLLEFTDEARSKGNAIFVELVDEDGKLIYTSDLSSEISYPSYENLPLSKVNSHFKYYNDYAVGLFKSSFSAELDVKERTKTQANEILLLNEAINGTFNEIIIEFPKAITKSDVLHYQSYLINLKLAAKGTPIGVLIPHSVVANASNHSILAEIMKIADFYVLDFSDMSAEQIAGTLSPLAYFTDKYVAIAIVSSNKETLAQCLSALESNGIESYIVK